MDATQAATNALLQVIDRLLIADAIGLVIFATVIYALIYALVRSLSRGAGGAPGAPPVVVPPVIVPPVIVPPTGQPDLALGSTGAAVSQLQLLLGVTVDGEFGPDTDAAVRAYQATHGLEVDGEVGPDTWAALLGNKPTVPSTTANVALPADLINKIAQLAGSSSLAHVSWKDRGTAPAGYTKGMAVAFGNSYAKWKQGNASSLVMAGAEGSPSVDALAYYSAVFAAAGMSNKTAGADTLRHLFVLLTGLGMRESSGQYNAGRDISALNTTADTAEAGLFQQSWNSNVASPEIPKLFAQWSANSADFLSVFAEGVPLAGSTDYGSGQGAAFQALCKSCPAFAVECAAVGLRVLRSHWGPIIRQEAEVRPEADTLFQSVQGLVDAFLAAPATPATPTTTQPPAVVPGVDPPWLTEARKYLGKAWGSGDPPRWMLDLIDGIKNNAANRDTPGFAVYCDILKVGYHEWCGIFVAGCLAAAGKAVPFNQADELQSFAWAASWDTWGVGVPVGDSRAGDIVRFKWHSGGAHVSMKEGTYDNDNYLHCIGGNQILGSSYGVTIAMDAINDTIQHVRRAV